MGRSTGRYCDGEPMVRLYTRGPGGKFDPLGYFCLRCRRIVFDNGMEFNAVPVNPGKGRRCLDCAFFLEVGEDGNETPLCTKENEFVNGDDSAGECEYFELSIDVLEEGDEVPPGPGDEVDPNEGGI